MTSAPRTPPLRLSLDHQLAGRRQAAGEAVHKLLTLGGVARYRAVDVADEAQHRVAQVLRTPAGLVYIGGQLVSGHVEPYVDLLAEPSSIAATFGQRVPAACARCKRGRMLTVSALLDLANNTPSSSMRVQAHSVG